jgi:signal transduction histidine kinase
VNDLEAETALLAPDHSVTITRPPFPVIVAGDADRLRQLLLNLADNARRYTPVGGRITFRVGLVGDQAEVAVADTGPGIAPADVPYIFNRFYRGDPARARPGGGAGLGLSIARAIAEAHGGCLTAANQPGGGAAFTLRLPLAASGGITHPPATVAGRSSDNLQKTAADGSAIPDSVSHKGGR